MYFGKAAGLLHVSLPPAPEGSNGFTIVCADLCTLVGVSRTNLLSRSSTFTWHMNSVVMRASHSQPINCWSFSYSAVKMAVYDSDTSQYSYSWTNANGVRITRSATLIHVMLLYFVRIKPTILSLCYILCNLSRSSAKDLSIIRRTYLLNKVRLADLSVMSRLLSSY